MFHTEDSTAEPVAEGDHDPVGRHPVEDMEEEEDEGADGTDDTDDGIEGAEEEEDEEEYTPHFEGAMDPLGFVQGAAPQGIELYQQFERLEYEILAERKRKALQDSRSCDQPAKKKAKNDEMLGVTLEEIEEMMSFGYRRRKRVTKKRGRAKGSRNKLSPEVSMRIADATLHYASGNFDEAIPILEEAVRLAPNLPDGYNLLGLIYDAMSDRKRALDFHMIAAHLSPKDISLWKKLIGWSIEQKNFGQVRYCLSKAITAEPKDVGLRFDLALLYVELGEYQKAAESYHQIVDLYPANCDARMMAAKMYQKCGLLDKAIGILENSFNDRSVEADQSYLIALHMENCSYENAIQLIEKAWLAFNSPNEIPFYLKACKAICYAHLGNMGVAEVFLQDLQNEHIEENGDLVNEVASAFMILGYFNLALKLYLMMDKIDGTNKAILHLKIAQCYASSSERRKAIPFFYKSLAIVEDNIDARITLSSLLVEEGKEDEAIVLLSPLKSSGALSNFASTSSKPWWLSEKVKIQLMGYTI
ncbi:hypothetical protein HPP92_014816 [Vanilla planifolia]|uniref:General transcription factor 3C polypeptide 3 n=1 Tax=Vanilla planifolia TaxID=51239 RepID=A0A835QKR1_VANPL|nr:hypothetical protein HPP92_014816 [Vanilla planifolia]